MMANYSSKMEFIDPELIKEAVLAPYVNDCIVDQYDKFPKEWCSVNDLRKRAKELSSYMYQEAEMLVREIQRRTELDPAIKNLSQNDGKAEDFRALVGGNKLPYDYNRTGKAIAHVFLNASDVLMQGRQNYILAALPRNILQTRDYFEAATRQGVSLFVSAHETGEEPTRATNFWKNEVLSQIVLSDDSTITNVSDIDAKGEKTEKQKQRIAHIVKNSLIHAQGTAEKTLTHLHIDGWRDNSPMHDEALLQTLLDEMEQLSPSREIPIAINCVSGVGRTGTIAVSYYLRREIEAQLRDGILLDDIRVNIPEVIYKFRMQRQYTAGRTLQLVQLYSALASYVEMLKKKQNQMLKI